MEEEQYLLVPSAERSFSAEGDSHSEEEWSGDSSDCSSYYTEDSDSSVPEWESYIEDSGRLLFVDCHPFVTQTNPEAEPPKQPTPLAKNQTRKSTRGKFLRLIRRRDSKRRSKRLQKSNDAPQENKVTFQDYDEGEIKEITLQLNGNYRYKLGRRVKPVESILGITIGTFSDGNRVMVAGFTPDSDLKNDKNIKIGDWLKSVNNVGVTVRNLNSILENLEGDEVRLELQRVTGVEVTKQPPTNELSNQSSFVKQLTCDEANEELLRSLIVQPIGVLYLNLEELTETGPEFEGVIYCYPTPIEKNPLCTSRGIFITINHLIANITRNQPQVTTLLIKQRLAHVVYTSNGSKLLLFMLPDSSVTSKEILMLNDELVRTLLFMFDSIDGCFREENRVELDHFFARFFTTVLSNGPLCKHDLMNFSEKPFQFESLLQMAHYIALPNEAQMQIDDALSELEACDYREWNEDPLDCQRLFTILGSALYHSGYLLSSHFIHGDLVDVHLYCRQQGLFHLAQTEPVRALVLWREVFPHSCNRNAEQAFVVPDESKRYLLIVGGGKDLLAVIMEAGGCTEPPEENLAPDAFYVEEAQATLAHLQELGISELAARWIKHNPQVTTPQAPTTKRRSDFLGNINFSKSASPSKENSPQGKKPDLTSILKRRSSDQGPLSQSGSLFSIPDDTELQSEDSVSQGGYSERSEVSDEPVLGRRAQRERSKNLDGSGDDESDIDDYRDGSQISTSSYDLSEIRHTLLTETSETQQMLLTTGKEPVLFHYVQLDCEQGILLCPAASVSKSQTLKLILNNFREACQGIHKIFKNTLRFKNMSSQDMTTSVMNKSLIAIKEYGTLFETNFQDEAAKKSSKISYWVIGRLFYTPHPREMYVCYQDSIPQNLIEMAFKLCISNSP